MQTDSRTGDAGKSVSVTFKPATETRYIQTGSNRSLVYYLVVGISSREYTFVWDGIVIGDSSSSTLTKGGYRYRAGKEKYFEQDDSAYGESYWDYWEYEIIREPL